MSLQMVGNTIILQFVWWYGVIAVVAYFLFKSIAKKF
jgi:hypothetical protein